jgi:hypothetical protein
MTNKQNVLRARAKVGSSGGYLPTIGDYVTFPDGYVDRITHCEYARGTT